MKQTSIVYKNLTLGTDVLKLRYEWKHIEFLNKRNHAAGVTPQVRTGNNSFIFLNQCYFRLFACTKGAFSRDFFYLCCVRRHKNMQRFIRLFQHQEMSCQYFLLTPSSPACFVHKRTNVGILWGENRFSVRFVQYTDPSAYFTYAFIV
jgi:hypothetical protein